MEETNNIIAKQTKLYPKVFRGVLPELPQRPRCQSEQLHQRVGAMRQRTRLRGVPDQSRPPARPAALRLSALGNRLLVSALRKAGRAGCSRAACPLRRLPIGPASLFASFHQRGKHCCRVAAEFKRVQGFPYTEDSCVARRGSDSLPLGAVRSELPAHSWSHPFLRAHAKPVLRHSALFERFARPADQDRRRGSMFVRHGAAGSWNGEGPAHRKMAG